MPSLLPVRRVDARAGAIAAAGTGARAGLWPQDSTHRSAAAALLIWSLAASTALANPEDGIINGGAGSIANSGNRTDITQTTDKLVIDWRGFNIGAGEITEFHQPNSGSMALNRVNSATPSQINGALRANGNIVIVNPNGVVFGSGAQVDANSVIATTSNISNAKFLAGQMQFDQPGNPTATVENRGRITAKDAGLVGLVAPNVINSGTITANLGKIQLSSGDSFTLDLYGDGLMDVKVSDAVANQLVSNSGTLNAAGGQIRMSAAAGRQVVNSLIEVGGELNAPAVAEHNGVIEIFAEGTNAVAGNDAATKTANAANKTGYSTVLVTGKINATNDHGVGGRITIAADHVGIASTAVIDASGTTGGGVIAIGGDLHGGAVSPDYVPTEAETSTLAAVADRLGPAPTPAALYSIVQEGAIIKANATDAGHGGLVSVWADDRTEYSGSIEANGGIQGGDGGLVETSGRGTLMALGDVRALSYRGRRGEWLLDPADIIIGTTATTGNITISGANPISYTANTNSAASRVLASTINSNLQAGTNVVISTGAVAGGGNGDITVSSAIIGTGGTAGGGLTLSAYRNIIINQQITLDGGALVLRADNADHASGSIYINRGITTNGGNITMGGGSGVISAGTGYATGNAAGTVISDVMTGYGIAIETGWAINAGSNGNIIMNGKGYASGSDYNIGVYVGISSSVIAAGTGTIAMNGTGGSASTGTGNHGILVDTDGIVRTANGALTLVGSVASSAGNYGYGINNSGAIRTTGSGSLTITGTGAGDSNYGVFNGSTISTNSGNLTITGTGGAHPTGYNVGIGNYYGGAISSVNGTITITGIGGAENSYSGFNYGLDLAQGSSITTTGTGGIILSGTGGGGTNSAYNFGIHNDSIVQATGGGSISMVGKGGTGSQSNNEGIYNDTHGTISTSGGGGISLNGTGGSGSGASTQNIGVHNWGTITTAGAGNISIIGTGGSGTGGQHYGIANEYTASWDGSSVNATYGVISTTGSGSITLIGTGGTGNNGQNHGIYNSSQITASSNGAISLTGKGGVGGGSNYGVYNAQTAYDYTDGNGDPASQNFYGTISTAGAGNISIIGTAGSGNAGSNYGIYNTSSISTSGAGNISLIGTGGSGTSGSNYGVSSLNIAASGAGSITITGIAVVSGIGVYIQGNMSTASGNITITGTGGGGLTASDNYGVQVSGSINAAGTGSLTITGVGGGSAGSASVNNFGVYVNSNSLWAISTVDGLLTITGTGGGSGSASSAMNYGVFLKPVASNRQIVSTTGTGNIVINGVSGNGDLGTNYGLALSNKTFVVKTTVGNITINADKLLLQSANNISAAGVLTVAPYTNGGSLGVGDGSYGGTLSLSTTYLSRMVGASYVFGSATTGDITLGTSRNFGSANVTIVNGAGTGDITVTSGYSSTGSGALTLSAYRNISVSSSITLTGGALLLRTDNADHASGSIYVGANISTNGGNITMGGGSGVISAGTGYAKGVNAWGIFIDSTKIVDAGGGSIIMNGKGYNSSRDAVYSVAVFGTVKTSGAGNIVIYGSGDGGGNPDDSYNEYGIYNVGSILVTGAGAGSITLIGTGGPGDGGGNSGVVNEYGTISTAGSGNISIIGTGKDSLNGTNIGVDNRVGGAISSVNGTITITGIGGAGNNNGESYGLKLATGSSITTTGTGGIILSGTAGVSIYNFSGGGNSGIYTDSVIQTTGGGSISMFGKGGDGSNSHGIYSEVNSAISTAGAGNINIVGTGGTADSGTNYGINSYGTITTTGSGNITLNGSGGTGVSGNKFGVAVRAGNIIQATGGGNILIRGTAGSGSSSYGFVDNTSGGIITSNGSGNAGNVTVVADTVNISTGTPFTIGSGGRWLIYSTNPANDILSTLMGDFRRFNCTYAGGCAAGVNVPSSGNGFFYSYSPTLTVTPAAQSVTYGNTATLSGFGVTGATYLTSSNVSTADSVADTIDSSGLVGTSNYTQGSNVGSYYINYVSGTASSALGYTISSYANNATAITVGQRTITTTLAGPISKTYDGTTTATLTGSNYTLGNVYSGDSAGSALAVATTSGTYDTANVGTSKMVTVTGLTLSGTKAGNYVLAASGVSGAVGTISQRAITITANNQSQTYGDGNSLTAGYTVGGLGLASGDTISGVALITTALSNSTNTQFNYRSTPWTIIASNAVGSAGFTTTAVTGNYAVTYNTGTLTVGQKTLTVTSSGGGKTYDNTSSVGGSLTLADDRVINDNVIDNYTSAAFSNVDVGNRTINVSGISISGADAANYTLAATTASNTAAITQRAITITANNQSQTYGDGNSLTAGYTVGGLGLASGDTISGVALITTALSNSTNTQFNYRSTPWTIIASNAVGSAGFTTTAVTGNYAVTYNTGTLTVGQKTLTVTSSGGGKTYDNTSSVGGSLTLADDRVINDNVIDNYTSAAFSNVDVGNRTINVSGISISGADAANYTLAATTASNTAAITQRALLVTTNDASKIVGEPAPIFTGSNNLLASDAALISWLYATATSPGDTPGAYPILATATDTSNRLLNYLRSNQYGNYTIAFAPPSSVSLPSSVEKTSQTNLPVATSTSPQSSTNVPSDNFSGNRSAAYTFADHAAPTLYYITPQLAALLTPTVSDFIIRRDNNLRE